MSLAGRRAGPLSLRAALGTLHRDRQWWLHCLGYGLAATTGVGLPLAAGFVMESLDNSRHGYPTPLPPLSDLSTRYIAGLLALLIDFAFFILPLFVGGLLLFCVSLASVIGAVPGTGAAGLPIWLGLFAGVWLLALFLAGVAPAGRLRFAREGHVEAGISGDTWRWTTAPASRGFFLRARLASLPAYLPAAGLGAAALALARIAFPGQAIVLVLAIWLIMAALVYAHLVVVQLYVAVERELERRTLGL